MLLKDYVSTILLNSKIFKTIYEGEQTEIDFYTNIVQDIVNQFSTRNATWGLSYMEEPLGITVDESRPYEFRRSVIKAKLRGTGTVTVNLINNVAESFSNGQVDVIEDNPNYSFIIKFIGTKGIPPNLEDLKNAIEEIKPAHLGVEYKFTYITWDEFDNYNKTWNEWDGLNLTWDEFETYIQ